MTVLEDGAIPASLASDDSRLRQASHISSAWCGDELVLLDARTGRYFTLNRVGGRMWELLATARSAMDLAECVRAEYDVRAAAAEATFERDVVRMLDVMLDAGLLVVERVSSPAQSPSSNPRHDR